MHFFMFVDLELSIKWLKPMGGSLFKKLHPFHISLRGVAHPIKASESSKSSHILSSTSNRFLNLHKVVLLMQCNCLYVLPHVQNALLCVQLPVGLHNMKNYTANIWCSCNFCKKGVKLCGDRRFFITLKDDRSYQLPTAAFIHAAKNCIHHVCGTKSN